MNRSKAIPLAAFFLVSFSPYLDAAAQDAPAASPEVAAPVAAPAVTKSEDEKAAEEDDGKLNLGVIASQGSYEHAASVNSAYSPEAAGGDAAPVSGSISRTKRDECALTLVNSDKKNSYRVSYEAVGKNDRGVQVVRKTYTSTLRPDEKVTKSLSCRPGLNMQVSLTSGKKVN